MATADTAAPAAYRLGLTDDELRAGIRIHGWNADYVIEDLDARHPALIAAKTAWLVVTHAEGEQRAAALIATGVSEPTPAEKALNDLRAAYRKKWLAGEQFPQPVN